MVFQSVKRHLERRGVFGPNNVISTPGFIQSNYSQNGAPGNFEVVVLNANQQLEHWWRDDAKSPPVWALGEVFGAGIAFSGSALIQSQSGNRGNFELVCVLKTGQMQHWMINNDLPGRVWAVAPNGSGFGDNIKSPPCMIEGMYGSAGASPSEYALGNFELVVATGGKLQHWFRENIGDQTWHQGPTFGDGHETSVAALIESSFSFNLEVIAGQRRWAYTALLA